MRESLLSAVRRVHPAAFSELAEKICQYQLAHNPVFRKFAELTHYARQPGRYPFLPIRFFKSHTVMSGRWTPQTEFTSSGTTGQIPSRHAVHDLDWYLENAETGFSVAYGPVENWRVLALLPAYLERSGSSLVAMADHFIHQSGHPDSGFFLQDTDRLANILAGRKPGEKTLLLGVSFALLDFAEKHPMNLSDVVVMETGGMKGRREEITREQLHTTLQSAFQTPVIHSEYGMTELFSQAYGQAGRYHPSPALRAICADVYDPLHLLPPGRTGTLNFIDLANLDTCSFIATEDLGRCHPDGSFEVLGRADAAEMRGCNLMVE